MQYMLLINADETAILGANPNPGEMSPEYAAYTEAMKKAGILRGGDRLQPTSAGRRVRFREGKAVVLDGPFVDTKEQLGGYYLIDVPSLEKAVDWAKRCPGAGSGSIDVRPVWVYAD